MRLLPDIGWGGIGSIHEFMLCKGFAIRDLWSALCRGAMQVKCGTGVAVSGLRGEAE